MYVGALPWRPEEGASSPVTGALQVVVSRLVATVLGAKPESFVGAASSELPFQPHGFILAYQIPVVSVL